MDRLIASLPGLFLLLGIGFVLALLAAVLYTYNKLRTPPRKTTAWAISKNTAADPSELDTPLAFESWHFTAQHGNFRTLAFPVWDITAHNPAGPTLIITPGWGDSRLGALRRIQQLAPACARILAWDPPGLGQAPGKTTLGIHEPSLLNELVNQLDTPSNRIVLFGSSMGAGISIAAAATREKQPLAVIAEAPYILPHTPAYNVLREAGIPWRLNGPLAFALLGHRMGVGPKWKNFDRALHATQLHCPLLLIHGTHDTTCPLDDSKTIASATPNASLTEIQDAGHNNLWSEEPFASACAKACTDFLQQHAMPTDIPAASHG